LDPAPPPGPTALAWKQGQQVGNYTLGPHLGQGGMGVVFRARHRVTGEEVALKGIPRDAEAEDRQRFRREAEALATARGHPHVARVLDAGVHGDALYLATELCPGGDLRQQLRLGPRPMHDAVDLVARISRGIAHLHAHGILHRDLKPANVLFDTEGSPKLVDFGLARVGQRSDLTHTGQFMGTPAYASPEQALGHVDDIDERTDVYGLGGILYAALTAQPPFPQTNHLAVLCAVVEDAAPPPSSVRPDIEPELDAICLRALAKSPQERYPSALAMAEALEAWAKGSGGGAASAPRRAPVVLGALLLGALAGFAGGRALPAKGVASASPNASLGASPKASLGASPNASLGASPSASQSASPTPTASPKLERSPPSTGSGPNWKQGLRPLLPDMLATGTAVIVHVPKNHFPQLGYVVDRTPEGLRVYLADTIVTLPADTQCYPDLYDVGARVFAPDMSRKVPAVVKERRGFLALIEFATSERYSVPVTLLRYVGNGTPAKAPEAKIQWAPRPGFARGLHAAISIGKLGRALRMVYLFDGGGEYIPRNRVRENTLKPGDSLAPIVKQEVTRIVFARYVGGILIRGRRSDVAGPGEITAGIHRLRWLVPGD
jgi:serine/threonine protein kinase